MLSGNSNKRTWKGPWPPPAESFWGPEDTTQDALQEKAMGFNCMNYEPGKNEPSFAYPYMRNKTFLDANCINGVRAEIIFPSCWDGKNLDSKDHKSHVAFPSLIQDGICPQTHPIYLPILFYETIWQTNAFADVPGEFIFANGDPTGYGYHADFIAAWDDGVQEKVKADATCTNLQSDGEVESCPVFDGHIQSQADAKSCQLTLPASIADEQTEGFLEQLPGNVKVVGNRHDPGDAPNYDEPYVPTTSLPATRSSAAATNAAETASGYYSSAVSSANVTSPPSTAAPVATSTFVQPLISSSSLLVTSPPAPSPTQNAGNLSTITTTYTSGKYVVEMVLIETVETVTATTAPVYTHTVVVPANGRKDRRRRHLHDHLHYHEHF